jgi:Flp pilus assembly protein TadD
MHELHSPVRADQPFGTSPRSFQSITAMKFSFFLPEGGCRRYWAASSKAWATRLRIEQWIDAASMQTMSSSQLELSKRLAYASGYLQLGMTAEAAKELARVPDEFRSEPAVLVARLQVEIVAGHWTKAAELGARLTTLAPDQAQSWISWAFAVRRSKGIEPAREILQKALRLHRQEPTIIYNLACYACQLGKVDEARELLEETFAMGPEMRAMALEDEDLEPLREWILALAKR